MRFSISWIRDALNAAAEERATVGDLRIQIAGQNVCEHVDGVDGKLYDHITVPAYSLAEGLAYGWWRIFGARDHDYELIQHRMGFATPNIKFRFDGDSFVARSDQHKYRNPNVRFWGGLAENMTRSEAECALSTFIDDVFSQLTKSNLNETSAQLRWNRVLKSRLNADEVEFCEAAGALGVDPYSMSEKDAQLIEQSARKFSGEPLIEFLAGISDRAAKRVTLDWIEDAESRQGYRSRLPQLAGLAKQLAEKIPHRENERGWALGYRRARAARTALGLGTGYRFREVSELAKLLGSQTFERARAVNGLRALVSTTDGDVHIHLRDRPATFEARQTELFAFVRAVGDAVCFPGTSRAVVNGLHEATRQAAGRAFGAEFLAPIDEVLSMQADDSDITEIADELNVSQEIIERQLENQDRIRASYH